MNTKKCLLATTMTFASVAGLQAQTQYFQAQTGPDDTWNVYQVTLDGVPQNQAFAAAAANMQDHDGKGEIAGHLATVTSQLENDIIWRWANRGDIWIGLSDREGVAPGAQESQNLADRSTMGWAWVTGEDFEFNNWGANEPNDAGGLEDAGHIRNDGQWNDNRSGYTEDAPMAPVLQPGTSGDESTIVLNFRYVTEWETNAIEAIPGIRQANIFADFGARSLLPGPLGSPGMWGIREIRNSEFQPGTIFEAIDLARNPAETATIMEGEFALLDTADPDTNANPDGSVPGFEQPFLSNDLDPAVPADDNIITVAHGTVKVVTPGDYTFQVRSDDGFAFRIPGLPISKVYGPDAAGIDPLAPDTAFFRNGTGDANTRIVYNLPAGVYDVEFIHWEGGGGAFYELSSSRGDIETPELANWILVGDTVTTFEDTTLTDLVQLNGELTVYKKDVAPNPDPPILPSTVALMDDAVANGTADFTSTEADALFGEGELEGTDDNYQLRVDGSFTVDNGNETPGEKLQVSFALKTDDGSAFHILGESFTAVAGDARATLLDIGEDVALASDYYSGDDNPIGHIELTEGVTYQFQSYMFEGGGGSRYEVQAALGFQDGFNGSDFFILSSTTDTLVQPANVGLEVVAPGGGNLKITDIGVATNGDVNVTFNSFDAALYTLEASLTLAPDSWTALSNETGLGSSTTVTVPAATIQSQLGLGETPTKLFIRLSDR